MPERWMPRRTVATRALGVVLATLLLVEAATLALSGAAPLVPVTLLIGSLAAVAYAAFVGGIAWGLVAAVLLGAYTLHWETLTTPASSAGAIVSGGVVMLVIGSVVAIVVGLLKRRSDAASAAAVLAEHEYAEAMRRANAQLEQANEALQAFTYLVSHDLKEPVRSTDMLLEFLERDHAASMDADARELLSRARRANARLAALLASLLELSRASRIDARAAEPVRVQDALAGETARLRYQSLAEERGAKVDVDVRDAPPVAATPDALQQVFGNLVANAISHNANGKPPEVLVRSTTPSEPRYAAFVVEDNGPGFPPALLARFERAEPLPSSTKDGGFGLIIARRAVVQLGGRMTLGRSDRLGGARVLIEIPVAPSR